ncbi:UDP-N-acetylmuramoyl-tripeptide--D-alanyl-D-alanine ligase [Nitrococcus mobilis]|uniref:UDP-N-acetylmuramoyl-tripeptide--D-alanyl-D-alanine ligase n=1 Tax=Nitrococcus mobilis Nb-231 TaxID=314278 RepID=A4BQJ0_9GAMM|nr:UDP-N-acetylmuramoyl-tripeptide--D-alanyl-D-alanine ligase [Nitrococcus mobilis]EAR21840.1 UDP-N-acetylmuramoylalanyl-D-glutamyl-2, 6-diaminopimelate-D-alanyl-D-alanyl ligase [Nitrococcus mobilis Nb-231]
MDAVSLSRLVADLGGHLRGPDTEVIGAALDSRRIRSGELFVALTGSRADGHDYLSAARTAGAAAALLERAVPEPLPQWIVADGRGTLAALGCWVREHCAATQIVAVTGSNGKTTVKEMLAAILARHGATLATSGNYNNELGVPLTLCRLQRRHRYAVLELGASAPGQIRRLTQWVRPSVGVITNAGPAHLDGFGSVAGVARGKGELFETLPDDGIAVINVDDAFANLWQRLARPRRCITFGLDRRAEVRATTAADGQLELRWDGRVLPVRLPLLGRHNQLNALASAATALALELPGAAIRAGLEAMRPVPGRLCWREGIGGARILDDTYNANPASLAAAIRVLAENSQRRWLVLGDMAELGETAGRLHRRAGQLARAGGVERLFVIGELAAASAAGFGLGAECFDDREALVKALSGGLGPDIAVLIKGSRSAAMDIVADRLAADKPDAAEMEG